MEKKKWSQPKLLSLNNKETAVGTVPRPCRVEGDTFRAPAGPNPSTPSITVHYMS